MSFSQDFLLVALLNCSVEPLALLPAVVPVVAPVLVTELNPAQFTIEQKVPVIVSQLDLRGCVSSVSLI